MVLSHKWDTKNYAADLWRQHVTKEYMENIIVNGGSVYCIIISAKWHKRLKIYTNKQSSYRYMYIVYENFPVFWRTQIWSLIMTANADT